MNQARSQSPNKKKSLREILNIEYKKEENINKINNKTKANCIKEKDIFNLNVKKKTNIDSFINDKQQDEKVNEKSNKEITFTIQMNNKTKDTKDIIPNVDNTISTKNIISNNIIKKNKIDLFIDAKNDINMEYLIIKKEMELAILKERKEARIKMLNKNRGINQIIDTDIKKLNEQYMTLSLQDKEDFVIKSNSLPDIKYKTYNKNNEIELSEKVKLFIFDNKYKRRVNKKNSRKPNNYKNYNTFFYVYETETKDNNDKIINYIIKKIINVRCIISKYKKDNDITTYSTLLLFTSPKKLSYQHFMDVKLLDIYRTKTAIEYILNIKDIYYIYPSNFNIETLKSI